MTDKTKKYGYDDKTAKAVEKLLHKQRMIGLLWSIDDVKMRRRELKPEQCWRVLQDIERRHDPEHGVNWDTIEQTAFDLFGTSNAERAERCQRALATYDEPELADLLTDAMHWCDANASDFDAVLETARTHFEAETKGE
jgi:hypothetical protein